jgi:hypothetical protein
MTRFSIGLLVFVSAIARHSAAVTPGVSTASHPVKATSQAVSSKPANIDKDSLTQFVHDRLDLIQACYEKELPSHATLQGRIAVQFVVTPSGHVRQPRVEHDTVHDAAVSNCVVRQINAWVTPFKPSSSVSVSYPFFFAPTEQRLEAEPLRVADRTVGSR